MTYFQLFNLTVPVIWPAVIIASFVATLLYKFATAEKVADWFWDTFFSYIFTWKFSYILFHFNNVLHMPLSAIYFNGGLKGHWLAVFIIALYITLFVQKKYPQTTIQIGPVLMLYIASFEALFQLFNREFFYALTQSGFLIAIFILIRKYKQLHTKTLVLLIAIELMILSLQHTLSLTKLLTYSVFTVVVLIATRKEEFYVKK
ncbi:hypothetical protein [Solibacillus sp. CAU 1738]|uniref:hypothetical protein n=1 Tax=Solibacillus sp. CAU 1738 TaxID=3140363 RepID=UPI003261297A